MLIDGLFALKQAGKKTARPYQITVKIGKPIHFESGRDPAKIASELQDRVVSL
jgi:hypothetical protein